MQSRRVFAALAHITSGKMRARAATTVKRSAFFPEGPTMIEWGVPGYDFRTWYALLVPAATPDAIIDVLEVSDAGTV